MAVEAEAIAPKTIEESHTEQPSSPLWPELVTKTHKRGSEKLKEFSAYMALRTGEFFAITAKNTFVEIPGIVKTSTIHGVLIGAALATEAVLAQPEHLPQWYVITLGLGVTSWGLSVLGKILPE